MATEEQIIALADRFHAAAVGASTWVSALEMLATLTGSRSGQLIGIGADKAIPFNWITNIDPDFIAEFAVIGGGDPTFNPRVRAGAAAREFEILGEADFLSPEEHRASPIYADFFARSDIPFICLTNVIKERDMLIGLTVNRSKREGAADENVRRIIATVAPHVRAAVRTQIALEGQGAALIAGAMEALSIAAFVCDRQRRVLARAPLTESLLGEPGPLRLVAGRLCARRAEQTEALSRAVATAALSATPSLSGLALSTEGDDAAPLVLDVAPLPARAHGFTLEARVLVVARLARQDDNAKAKLLRAAFELTPAEADIAVALLSGRTSAEIAAARMSSFHTVRTQIKALYAKLGVSNRTEFAARLARVN